jgi:hypothetical protein
MMLKISIKVVIYLKLNKSEERSLGATEFTRFQFNSSLRSPPLIKKEKNINQKCLNWINSLILHNFSGHAFSSLLSIFQYAMMEMEYSGSAEFSNYETNCFHTGGTRSGARTPTVWKIS